jgi:hypothetical protein
LEVRRDGLYEGLRTADRLLRFPLTDMCNPIVTFMPENEQVGQDAAQACQVELAALKQLPDKTGMDPVVPPASCRVWGRQSRVEQGRNGGLVA